MENQAPQGGTDERAEPAPRKRAVQIIGSPLPRSRQVILGVIPILIMKPTILLMDEPFGALDPGTREDLQLTIIETFEEQKTTIFFVTHDLEEAIFVGTRLLALELLLRRGRQGAGRVEAGDGHPYPQDTHHCRQEAWGFSRVNPGSASTGFRPGVPPARPGVRPEALKLGERFSLW